jgi:transposase
MKPRRTLTADFKAKVALEAIQAHLDIKELATRYSVSISQIRKWKEQLITNAHLPFSEDALHTQANRKAQIAEWQERIHNLQEANNHFAQRLLQEQKEREQRKRTK